MTQEAYFIFLDMMVCRIDILRFQMKRETHMLSNELYVNLVLGHFYEIIKLIFEFDPEGYKSLNMNISKEDFKILGEARHSIFHAPGDVQLYKKRSIDLHEYMGTKGKDTGIYIDRILEYAEKILQENPWLKKFHDEMTSRTV